MELYLDTEREKTAIEFGAVKEGNHLVIPDDLSEIKKQALLSYIGRTGGKRAPVYDGPGPVRQDVPFSWDFQKSTLELLQDVGKNGLPVERNLRAGLFYRLAEMRPGDYPVAYREFCIFCPEAESLYPPEAMDEKLRNLPGTGGFPDRIKKSRLDEDEKAFLLFVLPC